MDGKSEKEVNAAAGIRYMRPETWRVPVIVASPHSGRAYSKPFLSRSSLPERLLRRSEDAYVDWLVSEAPALGGGLIIADFPRSYVDVNRHQNDLDRSMFDDAPPGDHKDETSRGRAGLGVVPRIAADGRPIYDHKIAYSVAQKRIETHYKPYHELLTSELAGLKDQFGEAILIDCHSMPSASARQFDIVLGDRFGTSCSPALSALAETAFRKHGLRVSRNRPYAGGYTTEHYGRPDDGIQAIQIEINRGLYLNEAQVTPNKDIETIKAIITDWMRDIFHAQDNFRQAAE